MSKSSVVRTRFACLATVILMTLSVTSDASARVTFTPIDLLNGWTNAPFSTRDVAVVEQKGIVRFEGAISGGSSSMVFQLPPKLFPSAFVEVPVDMCDGANGRLIVEADGSAKVEPESGDFTDAACFTSLEGVEYALNSQGFTPLTLQHGWQDYSGSRHASAKVIDEVVYLEGAMTVSGNNKNPFVLPPKFRPSTNVYVQVDLSAAAKGRLLIRPSGSVTVQVEKGGNPAARGFTSLDGVSFARSPAEYTPQTLLNGWKNAPLGTRSAAARLSGGFVHLQGAIRSGTDDRAFRLQPKFRPTTDVYVPVDIVDAHKGRLVIHPSGFVDVNSGTFSQAQAFTSLEGVTFATG